MLSARNLRGVSENLLERYSPPSLDGAERSVAMANPFVWVELHTADAEKAKKFYTDLLGWKLQPMGDMPYTLILGDQGGVGGITASPTQANAKPHWLTYIGVPNLDAATKKAKSLGRSEERRVGKESRGRG